MVISRRVGYGLLFGTLAVVSLVAAVGAITSVVFAEKVLPRTYVAGVNVSNLNYAEAQQKITTHAAELENLKITFTLQNQTANISLNALGVTVNPEPALTQVIRPTNVFDWIHWRYWQAIFQDKKIVLDYKNDPEVTRAAVEKALGVTTAATDAAISYDNGQLVVRDSKSGLSVADRTIIDAITTVLATGSATQTTLVYTESEPIITTATAMQAITALTDQLLPLKLSFGDQTFTVTVASQESFLDFTSQGGKITWQVSSDKVKNYLNTAIAPKVNIKMVPKTTKSDTGELIQAGVDGRVADITKLTTDIVSAMNTRTDTANSPLAIKTTAIPFTEKIIYPGYIAGLFPGYYADVNLTTQQMFILNGSTLVGTYLVSTGQAGLRTPPGQFYICNKITLARSPLYRSLWMPLWNALSKSPTSCAGYVGYGVHGLPCFNGSCTLVESAAHLGRPVSHGCVRLPDDGARWFYDNMPIGTPVHIHNQGET